MKQCGKDIQFMKPI